MLVMRNLLFLVVFMVSVVPAFSGGRSQEPTAQPPSPAPTSQPAQSQESQPPQEPEATSPRPAISFLAQDLWDFVVVPYETETLQAQVNARLELGFQPTGIHVIPGESISVLFSRIPLEDKRWVFAAIEPLNEVNAEFEAYLRAGWLPQDLSVFQNGLHTLFTVSPVEFLSWRVISVPVNADIALTLDALSQVGLSQAKENHFLYGISAFDNQIQLLFLATEIEPAGSQVVFRAFPNDGNSPFIGIDAMVADGALPAGFAVLDRWFIVPFYF